MPGRIATLTETRRRSRRTVTDEAQERNAPHPHVARVLAQGRPVAGCSRRTCADGCSRVASRCPTMRPSRASLRSIRVAGAYRERSVKLTSSASPSAPRGGDPRYVHGHEHEHEDEDGAVEHGTTDATCVGERPIGGYGPTTPRLLHLTAMATPNDVEQGKLLLSRIVAMLSKMSRPPSIPRTPASEPPLLAPLGN